MPREIWSIQLEITLQRALAQLTILEKRLLKIETRFRTLGAAASPAATKNLTKVNAAAKAAGNSATVAQGKFTAFFAAIRAQSDGFVTVLARRLAFMAAAMIEVFTFAFALAIPLAFAKSIKVGAEFQDAMLRTATVAAGGVDNMVDHFRVLEDAARSFAITVPFSATEVANAMFEMVSSGIATTETIGAMPAVMSFAGAAMTDLTTSVDIMTQIMKSFGLTASDLDDVADVLVVGLNKTTLTVERLQAALRFAAPAGGAFGQTIDDTVAVLASFVDATKQGGIAGRAFRFMMASLANPSSKAADAMAKLRDSTTGATIPMKEFALTVDGETRSIVDVLTRLSQTTIDSSQALEIFGNRSGPVVALAMRRLKEEFEESGQSVETFQNSLQKLQETMADGKAANVATKQFQTFLQSTASQFKLLRATAEEAMLRIFLAVQPLVNSFVEFIRVILASESVVNAFVNLSGELATVLMFLAGTVLLRLIGSLWATATAAIAAGGGMAAAGSGVLALRSAFLALKTVGLVGLFLLLVEVFQDLQAETNAMGRTMEALGRLFGRTASDADDMGASWTVVGRITDSLRVALAALAISFLTVFKAMATVSAATLDWIPGMEEQKKVIEENIEFVDGMIQSYQDEAAEILLNFGVREDRIKQDRRMREESQKRILANAALVGAEQLTSKVLDTLTDQESEMLDLITQRAVKEEELAGSIGDVQVAQFKLIVANEALDPIIRELAQSTLDLIQRNKDAAAAAEAAEKAAKRLADAYKSLNGDQLKAIEGVKQMALVLKDMAEKGVKPTETQLLRLSQRLREYEEGIRSGAIEPTNGLVLVMAGLRARLAESLAAMGLVVGKTAEWKSATKGLPKVLKDLEAQLRASFDTKTPKEFDETVRKLRTDFMLLKSAGLETGGMMKELRVRLIETARDMFEAGASSAEVNVRLAAMAELFGLFLPVSIEHANRMLDEFEGKSGETTEVAKSAFQDMFDKITQGMGNAIGEMIFSATSFGEFIEDLFKGILKLLVTQAFAGILAAFSNMLFGMETQMTGFAGTIQKGFGTVMDWADKLMESLPGMIGLVAGAAVAAFAIIKGLFGGDGALEAVERGLARLGGVSDDLAKKIKETGKEMGTSAALAQHFGEVMDEVGVTVKNFGEFVDLARHSLHALNRGEIDAVTATSQLNDNFARLAAEMKELGIVGNKDLLTLMNQIKASGLEVASVIAFIDENMRLAASGLETVVKGSLITTQDELDRLGRIAFAVFSEMIANGSSLIEALDAVGPSIDLMIEAMVEAGLEGSKALNKLRKWRRLIEDNREIVEGFEGLNDVLTGLANTGLLTQEVFEDLLAQALALATDLTNAGVKGKDAFVLMAPFLDNLIELAARHGLAIDDATQALIDQAEEYGVLGQGAQTEADIMREGFELIVLAVNRLIETLGGVPLALEDVGDGFDGMRDAAGDAFDSIEENADRAFDFLEKRSKKANDSINKDFDDTEENLVGNTVFRNIAEKGSAFLEQLAVKAGDIKSDMSFAGADQFAFPGMTPNILVSSPTPQLSDGRRGLTKFEQQNLAILGRLVDAVLSTGGSQASRVPGQSGDLRQTIGEVLREASLDGDAEFHVDSVGRLS